MIPILFEKDTTEFTTLGIGALTDCISCTVRRVLNGMDELEMSYPESGIRAGDIVQSRIIYAMPEWQKDPQPYRIYDITKPLNGIFYVYARHVSEQRAYIPVMPFTASSVSNALNSISANCAETCPFTFWTDKQTVANFNLKEPASLGNVLGGMAGSILDVYGGEYEFDKYTVKLWNRRGADRGVTLRYGKNITDIQQEESIDATVTGICPFWSDLEGDVVTLPEKVIRSANAQNFPFNRTVVKDFSDRFNEKPTVAQLRAAATSYVNQSGFGVPNVSIKVSFEMLAQYEEYKTLTSLESVNLGDTVHVIFERLGINADARAVETRYDVLNEKYKSISIGRVKSNMSTVVSNIENSANTAIAETRSAMQIAIDNATSQLTGADGGYLVDTFDLNGNRTGDMLMDTNDPATATNVWLRNIAGWGHSSNGVNGPYTTAITQDGKIVADFIQAGTLQGITIIGEDGKIGGWKIGRALIEKWSAYEEGVSSTVYRAFMSAPENPADNYLAFGVEKYYWDGSSLSLISQPFRVRYDGKVTATDGTFEGTIRANSGSINGPLTLGENGTISAESTATGDRIGLTRKTFYIENATTNERMLIASNGFTVFDTSTDPFDDIIEVTGGSSTSDADFYSKYPLRINAPSVTFSTHSSAIGTVVSEALSSSVSIPAATETALISFTLDKGVWIVFAYCKFSGVSNGGGRRIVAVSSTANRIDARIRNDAFSSENAVQQVEASGYLTVTNTTSPYYLNVYSTKACNAAATYTQITAVRLF